MKCVSLIIRNETQIGNRVAGMDVQARRWRGRPEEETDRRVREVLNIETADEGKSRQVEESCHNHQPRNHRRGKRC